MTSYTWVETRRLSQLTAGYDPDLAGLAEAGLVPHPNPTPDWGVDGVDLGANTVHDGKLFILIGDVPATSSLTPARANNADLIASEPPVQAYTSQCWQGVSWSGSQTAVPNGASPVVVTGGAAHTGIDAALTKL